jgi:hypothetical protein
MEAREKGICFGSSDFFNEAFAACQTCSRYDDCHEVIFSMNFETVEPEIKPEPTTEPGALDYEKLAPKLRKASIDFIPIIDAIYAEKPVNRKETAAIIRRFGVKASAAYGYAENILYYFGLEGHHNGYESPKAEIVWRE